MGSTTAVSARQHRWAVRENARRLNEHQASMRRWQSESDLNGYYHALAASAAPLGPGEIPAGLSLRKNEEVFWAGEGAVMVERTDHVGMFQPVHTVYSPSRRGAAYAELFFDSGTSRDRGRVVVTSRRVIFVGSRANREWAYPSLTGVVHSRHGAMTLMRVSTRQRDSGLVFDERSGDLFRFFLSLAIAVGSGDRPGFVAHLAQVMAQHEAQRPAAPHQVVPQQAPSATTEAAAWLKRLYLGPPGARTSRQVVPALTTAMIALCMCVALMPSPSQERPESTRPAAAAAKSSPPAALGAASSPSVSPSPTPAVATTTAAPVKPSPTKRPTSRPPSPKPTKTVNYCGAPKNPWKYNFCSGSTITSPPGDFCSYFNCIDNFWNGKGYVIQCQDGMFSKSGGRSGSCSYHQGNRRPLYR